MWGPPWSKKSNHSRSRCSVATSHESTSTQSPWPTFGPRSVEARKSCDMLIGRSNGDDYPRGKVNIWILINSPQKKNIRKNPCEFNISLLYTWICIDLNDAKITGRADLTIPACPVTEEPTAYGNYSFCGKNLATYHPKITQDSHKKSTANLWKTSEWAQCSHHPSLEKNGCLSMPQSLMCVFSPKTNSANKLSTPQDSN